MIIKSFEINKINLKTNKLILLYGENHGAKEELTNAIKEKKKVTTDKYFENEILANQDSFIESISSKSFFDNEKLIIIKKVTNKIYKLIEEIIEKNYEELTLILDAGILEKKSKLRNLFEKNNNLICIAFYPDDQKTLNILVNNFLKKKKIKLSQEATNLITERANGSREHLKNELEKISNFSLTRKTIDTNDIIKLTNRSLDYKVSELVDYCLSKNEVKVLKSINDNNFNNDDTFLILRTFLFKAKRLLKLKNNSKNNTNLESVISSYKPPIFWKDKEIIKSQLKIWTFQNVLNLIREINNTEFLSKKKPHLSTLMLNNFILKNLNKINN
jgi:DNA polymerase III subunit delta